VALFLCCAALQAASFEPAPGCSLEPFLFPDPDNIALPMYHIAPGGCASMFYQSSWGPDLQVLGDPNRMNFSAITGTVFVGHTIQVDINDSLGVLIASLTGLTFPGVISTPGQRHDIGSAAGEGVSITPEQWQNISAGSFRIDIRNISDARLPIVDLTISHSLSTPGMSVGAGASPAYIDFAPRPQAPIPEPTTAACVLLALGALITRRYLY
jgi:hypothetical protein